MWVVALDGYYYMHRFNTASLCYKRRPLYSDLSSITLSSTRSPFICLGLWLLAFLCSMPVIIWRESSLLPKSFKITNLTARTSTMPTCLISLYPASYIACTTIASFLIPAVITAGLRIRILCHCKKTYKSSSTWDGITENKGIDRVVS